MLEVSSAYEGTPHFPNSPSAEYVSHAAVCLGTIYTLRHEADKLILIVETGTNKVEKDIKDTKFSKTYLSKKYVGKFVTSCLPDGRFGFGFAGYEILRKTPPVVVFGGFWMDKNLTVTSEKELKPTKTLDLLHFMESRESTIKGEW